MNTTPVAPSASTAVAMFAIVPARKSNQMPPKSYQKTLGEKSTGMLDQQRGEIKAIASGTVTGRHSRWGTTDLRVGSQCGGSELKHQLRPDATDHRPIDSCGSPTANSRGIRP